MFTARASRTLALTLPLLALACDKSEAKPSAAAAKKSASAANAEGKYDARRKKDDAPKPTAAAKPKPAKVEGKAAPKAPEKKARRSATQVPPPENLAAAPGDATKAANGVSCTVLTSGEGELVKLNDSVKMHYTGWSMDGTTVETSEGRKSPRTVRVNRTPIPGWADALQMMKAGEKRRCWIPQEQGFVGRANAPEGPLVYDIEVVEVIRAPVTPPNVSAAPADAEKTESGLAYKSISKGTGKDHPDKWDQVTVHYSGWTTDGKMFDSSATRGKPATFGLDKVIPGWTEGLQLMVKGEKARLWIPEALAYAGRPGKPAGMLVFDVELVEIIDQPEPPPPPPVPEDVAAAPDDAKKTDSGLRYKVLSKGTGKDKPTAENMVKVNYSGWTTDGKMFDSSIVRGKPAEFPLGRVIAGWTEGLQLMVVGEKTRFWIPEDLAYKGRPGKPAGMLVFDVELLEIK